MYSALRPAGVVGADVEVVVGQLARRRWSPVPPESVSMSASSMQDTTSASLNDLDGGVGILGARKRRGGGAELGAVVLAQVEPSMKSSVLCLASSAFVAEHRVALGQRALLAVVLVGRRASSRPRSPRR